MGEPARPRLRAFLKWIIPLVAIAGAGYLAWISPALRPSADRIETMLADADTALLAGRLDAAKQGFARVAALQPERARAHFGLGLVSMREGRYAEALAALDTAARLEPDNPDHAYARARTLTLLGRRDEAIEALTKLHESAPERPEVENDRIALLIDAQRWSDAEIAVTEALGRTASQYNLRIQAGRIAGHAGNHLKAIEHYEMARIIRPYAPQPLYGLIEEYRALERIDDARKLVPLFEKVRARAAEIEQLRTAARSAPADPAPSMQYLERLFAEGWLDEAIEQTNSFLNLHTGQAGSRAILLSAASASAETGDKKGALRFLELAGGEDSDGPEGLAVADILLEAGEPLRARAVYEKRLKNASEDPAALTGMGRAELKANQVEEAERWLRRAVAAAPDSAQAHAALGLTLAQKTDFEPARAELEKALSLDPRQPDALFGLGFLAQQQGRRDEAERYLRQTLDSRPGYAAARIVLALTLSNQGRCEEAIPLFIRCLQLDPRNMTLHAGLVRCLETTGKTAEALQARQLAEQLLGKSP